MRNIPFSTLSMKVLYAISHHMSAKGMCDVVQTLYKDINDVKDYKINMFTKESDLFRMKLENL